MPEPIKPLTLDIQAFKKRFHERQRYRWTKPSVWLISNEPSALYRDLEVQVILNLFEQAKHFFRYRVDIWSNADRFEEIRTLADFAYEHGVSIINLLTRVMLYSDEHCRRMLLLSGWKPDVAKIELTIPLYSRSERIFNNQVVKHQVATLRKPCPGKQVNKKCVGEVPANHDLCWECHQIFGFSREEYPKWLLFMVRDDDREYRRRATEILYHQELPDEVARAA